MNKKNKTIIQILVLIFIIAIITINHFSPIILTTIMCQYFRVSKGIEIKLTNAIIHLPSNWWKSEENNKVSYICFTPINFENIFSGSVSIREEIKTHSMMLDLINHKKKFGTDSLELVSIDTLIVSGVEGYSYLQHVVNKDTLCKKIYKFWTFPSAQLVIKAMEFPVERIDNLQNLIESIEFNLPKQEHEIGP